MTNKNLLQKHKMYTNNNQSLLSLNYWAPLASQVEELEKILPKPPELKSPPSPGQFPKIGNEMKKNSLYRRITDIQMEYYGEHHST